MEELTQLIHAAAREAKLPEPEADGGFDGDALVWTWAAREGGESARVMLRAQLDALGEHVSMRLLPGVSRTDGPEGAWTEAYPGSRVALSALKAPDDVKSLATDLAGQLRAAWSDAGRTRGHLEAIAESRRAALAGLQKAAKEFGFTIDQA